MKNTITRRDFVKTVGVASMAMPGLLQSVIKAQDIKSKPNIIFIVTDDQRWDTMGVMGNKIIQTPNMDYLANNGLLFTNNYVTTSICCASRASILTGQYTSRHKINDFNSSLSDEALQYTYPLLLKKAGYKIGFAGKYGVGIENQPKEYFDYWGIAEGHQPDYLNEDVDGNIIHDTDRCKKQIEYFINEFGKEEPFCLSVSFKAPHCQDGNPPGEEFIYQFRYEDLYEDVEFDEPINSEDSDWESFPEFFKENNESRIRWKKRFATPELFQISMKNYYRLITGVDDVLGSMMKQLKELNIADNTIIVFTGDNGMYLGEHQMAGKWYGHEPSIRTPLFIYDPRLPKSKRGKRFPNISLNIDIAPTILALAGISIPKQMHGKNLLNLLNDADEWRKEFFYEHTVEIPTIPKSEGIVSPPYKYMVFTESEPKYEWLFNIEDDPDERNNLALDTKYDSILNKYRGKYRRLKESAK
ncbi:MAG: sulfatase [Ignavibacteria bacterium]|jgi:arylsulfatase A-like enzyme